MIDNFSLFYFGSSISQSLLSYQVPNITTQPQNCSQGNREGNRVTISWSQHDCCAHLRLYWLLDLCWALIKPEQWTPSIIRPGAGGPGQEFIEHFKLYHHKTGKSAIDDNQSVFINDHSFVPSMTSESLAHPIHAPLARRHSFTHDQHQKTFFLDYSRHHTHG